MKKLYAQLLMIGLAAVASAQSKATRQTKIDSTLGPSFIQNKGQWNAKARYMAQTDQGAVWLTSNGATFDFQDAPNHKRYAVALTFGHGAAKKLVPSGARSGQLIFGKRRAGRYSEVKLVEVQPGVDARFYLENGRPRYDIVIHPGTDPSSVQANYQGARHLRTEHGVLAYDTDLGTIREQGLRAYQGHKGGRSPVNVEPTIHADGSVHYKLGAYDRTKDLVIDPIVWASQIGSSPGPFSQGWNWPAGCCSADDGSVFLYGYTQETDFPGASGEVDFTSFFGLQSLRRWTKAARSLGLASFTDWLGVGLTVTLVFRKYWQIPVQLGRLLSVGKPAFTLRGTLATKISKKVTTMAMRTTAEVTLSSAN